MSQHISDVLDVSGMEHAHDFQTGTICGPVELEERHGTSKCFHIIALRGLGEDPVEIIMPKLQALLIASQIASQFGYTLEREMLD